MSSGPESTLRGGNWSAVEQLQDELYAERQARTGRAPRQERMAGRSIAGGRTAEGSDHGS